MLPVKKDKHKKVFQNSMKNWKTFHIFAAQQLKLKTVVQI